MSLSGFGIRVMLVSLNELGSISSAAYFSFSSMSLFFICVFISIQLQSQKIMAIFRVFMPLVLNHTCSIQFIQILLFLFLILSVYS